MSQRFVIGVDGGGTKTLGLLMNGEGEEISRTAHPSSNIHSNPHNQVEEVMQSLVESLCVQAKISVDQVDAICLGMAGCDSPKDRAVIEGFLRPIIKPTTKITIVNDAIVAMRAVLETMHGLLLIAGTGSICFGWNEQSGESARCGGWGHLLADEGSGYAIGMEALKAILKAVDGRGAKTPISKAIIENLELDPNEPRDIIQFVYGDMGTKARIASLARFVMEAAEDGDEVALSILDQQADDLITLLGPVQKTLFADAAADSVPLGIWGGNLIHVEVYREMFLNKLKASGLPLKAIIKPEADAVFGAARHALITFDDAE